ncbi:DUF3795 domain-containing protein [Anaerostipes sp.]|uniref:DUF3795 domain-containing protein n=1 Tax=Anaerostipes sp. TaxID=1872530 RepID=UPI0025C57FB4|nr:DUF3795 domain-containing protein [Anaerostipes sp.]MBS7009574.1 DUF3795 domain-containing protein [Anaerostipes sp.]
MKMPEKTDAVMFAPCGMNCLVCYKHCFHKKPCSGCLKGDEGKPEHCRRCRIRECTAGKNLSYCYECADFPCRRIKSLEKSYNSRYHTSLIENSNTVKLYGIEALLEQHQKKYKCPKCGGIISLHDQECSECKYRICP